ncbi:MAG: arginine deiminase [Tissierellia bacterium]|nr:arginine deiminase [Tissierellia bacterium]
MNPIHIYSEVNPLKEVLLHRPGRELNNLIPDFMEELLFDEIPYLEMAQEEHDRFADILRENGAQVYYLEDLAAEVMEDPRVKEEFIKEYIEECHIDLEKEQDIFYDYLMGFDDEKELILKTMEGTRRRELKKFHRTSLAEMVYADRKPFVAEPMPNLYFTRDPFSFVGNGVSINHMWSNTRNRETIYGKYIMKYHEDFKNKVPQIYDREQKYPIEGGDILVLSDTTVAIGISQRTSPQAIEKFTKNLLEETSFQRVLAFQIPDKRAFMHLDTVFTMVDVDLFTIHPLIEEPLVVYSLEYKDGILLKREKGSLREILREYLGREVHLIPCGGDDPLDASREQWNDGSNTLAIAPREVIVYDRNTVTNQLLEEYGVKLHIMRSGELSRGRGGPRCMSMPLKREP